MRREFTNETKRLAYDRSGGVCECRLVAHAMPDGFQPCGLPLGAGNTFYEHINPDFAGGDNSLTNCAVLTKTCWKLKTARHDLPIVAKIKRNRDRHRGNAWFSSQRGIRERVSLSVENLRRALSDNDLVVEVSARWERRDRYPYREPLPLHPWYRMDPFLQLLVIGVLVFVAIRVLILWGY